jgi:hypothetical protein
MKRIRNFRKNIGIMDLSWKRANANNLVVDFRSVMLLFPWLEVELNRTSTYKFGLAVACSWDVIFKSSLVPFWNYHGDSVATSRSGGLQLLRVSPGQHYADGNFGNQLKTFATIPTTHSSSLVACETRLPSHSPFVVNLSDSSRNLRTKQAKKNLKRKNRANICSRGFFVVILSHNRNSNASDFGT